MGIVTRCWMIKVNQIGAIKHPVSHFCAFAGKFRKQRRTNSQATTHEQRSRFETANRVVRSEQWVCSSRIFAFYSFLNIFCQIKFSPRKPFRKAVMQHVCWISLKVNHRNSDVEVIKTKQLQTTNRKQSLMFGKQTAAQFEIFLNHLEIIKSSMSLTRK